MSARRKKRPHNPATDRVPHEKLSEVRGQLGLPTPERRQHSEFEAEQLAPGAPQGGVLRSRVKGLFTLPDQKRALIEAAIHNLRVQGKIEVDPDDIHVEQTTIDRNFLPVEYEAISWFIAIHARVEGSGRGGITNYQGSPRSESHDKMAYSDREGKDRAEHAYVRDRLPEAYLAFLDWVAWVQFPEEFGNRAGKPPTKTRVGQALFYFDESSPNPKYNRDCVDGYFKAITQNIAHWRFEYDTALRRKSLAVKELSDLVRKASSG